MGNTSTTSLGIMEIYYHARQHKMLVISATWLIIHEKEGILIN